MAGKRVYLDHASTTPLSPVVAKVLSKIRAKHIGNPGSFHKEGVHAKELLRQSREGIAQILHAHPSEIFFTSGTTEGNNIALLGHIEQMRSLDQNLVPHVITSAIEHHSVLKPLREFQRRGLCQLTVLPVTKEGLVQPGVLKRALQKDTTLVSIMYANNEIGSVQPIRELAAVIRQFRKEAITQHWPASDLVFHTDAAQAPGYLPLDVERLGIDLLTIGAHKFYGPLGVGVLYKRRRVKLSPRFIGGGQESSLRPGTQPVDLIMGMHSALLDVTENSKREVRRLTNLQRKLINQLQKKVPGIVINGSTSERLPNNVHFSVPGFDGELLVLELDARGFAVSTGSACTTDELGPSHVVLSLHQDQQLALGSVRVSLGKSTTWEELQNFVRALQSVFKKYEALLLKK